MTHKMICQCGEKFNLENGDYIDHLPSTLPVCAKCYSLAIELGFAKLKK